ncbi:(2Fe-2S)-binding protein [Mesorhizobium sp. YC-39]|uniref:(2Fe-2S)-binding protein n=1 Tax=unclassified Mesorhizobium TaxID=325217 RepID=UPI0021E95766|nr:MULTISPECIES: (2Fe-2S)-binding protein [unclassified Mesorhizobium]MCV3205291.1 (2Fe-2S)-binding protein [Mesorhizobium sp. YC-2]MCV3228310.1 (2Fe-2S)-binding protein [Mesorhizobium sp. YC-39]
MPTNLVINGEDRISTRGSMTPLIDVLRDEFFLTGAKVACREGICGACTVHLDGRPVVSCLVPLATVEGRDVRTVESLAAAGEPSPLQQIMEEHDVVQCGMCFPGILMVLTSFFQERPHAERDDIKAALVGNICRCTGYERLVDAAAALARRS